MIRRPSFYEGQILGPRDLERTVEYSREQDARHERYLHTWGVAEGLDLRQQDGEWFLSPGMAIDSTGAPIIVSEPILFTVGQVFDDALPGEKDDGKWIPAFVFRAEAKDDPQTVAQRCGETGPSRIRENAQLVFRSILQGWDDQTNVPVPQGPGPADDPSRLVLIGFVKWKKNDQPKGTITEFRRLDDDGNGPRFAGVSADDVIARNGELSLWSRVPAKQVGSPAMLLGDRRPEDHPDRKALRLGVDDKTGKLNELVTVDPQGNLFVKGNIEAEGLVRGKLTKGEVSIESGIAADGMTLPLPPEITHEQVASGNVVLHTSVTPRLDRLADTEITNDHAPLVVECSVDEKLLVHCVIRWLDATNLMAFLRKQLLDEENPDEAEEHSKLNPIIEVPGTVNYTIIAYVNQSPS